MSNSITSLETAGATVKGCKVLGERIKSWGIIIEYNNDTYLIMSDENSTSIYDSYNESFKNTKSEEDYFNILHNSEKELMNHGKSLLKNKLTKSEVESYLNNVNLKSVFSKNNEIILQWSLSFFN